MNGKASCAVKYFETPEWDKVENIELLNAEWTENPEVSASFRIFHDDRSLHVAMDARERDIRAELTGPLDPVHMDSCLEFFLEPRADGRYFNFEINPLGTLCLGFGRSRVGRLRLVPNDMARFNITPCRREGGWGVTFEVPLDFIRLFFPDFEFVGECRANFYKCGDSTPLPHYLSWSRIESDVPDFHRPQDFGRLIFS